MHNPTWPPVAKLSYSWEVHLNLGLGSSIGPSGVRALPLAAGINEGGHYFRYFGPSGVRALPLAAGINEGGHYFAYFWSERRCADGV